MASNGIKRSWGKRMKLKGCQDSDLLVKETKIMIMSKSSTLEKILVYIARKKVKAALEAKV